MQIPQQQNVTLDTLSGVDGYDIKLGGWTRFAVRDPSSFFGTLGYRGDLGDYADLVLSASEAFTPHVNVLDAGYGLRVNVADANAFAEIGLVTNAAPGLMDKTGAGKLRAVFSQADSSYARVSQGELAVHDTASADGLTIAAAGALGVEDSLVVRNLGVEGSSLAKTGSGKLTVGNLHAISGDQTGFASAPAGIAVSAGSFAIAAPSAADPGAIAPAPRLHLDASAAGAFVTETSGDDTLVATWNGVGEGAISATGVAADSGRKPKLVTGGLNGKPIVDCGAFVGDGISGDGTSGYLTFPDSAVREAFMVVRAKSTGVRRGDHGTLRPGRLPVDHGRSERPYRHERRGLPCRSVRHEFGDDERGRTRRADRGRPRQRSLRVHLAAFHGDRSLARNVADRTQSARFRNLFL